MLRRAIPFLLLASVPVAVVVAGVSTSACGGCYISGDTKDIQVDPATACLTVAPGHSEHGCSGPDPTGVKVTNGCAEPLVIGAVTVAPGQKDVSFGGTAVPGGRRSITGTLGSKPIVISWVDAADVKAVADAQPDG